MNKIGRREFVYLATMFGASAAWSVPSPKPSAVHWRENRDLFPEGVASGDPDSNSVLLWTRRHPIPTPSRKLIVEVSQDQQFRRVVATQTVPISAEADWTCRVLVGGLKPAQVYWYRFTDTDGNGSRVGRTITAPAADDRRPVRFAFVSCQDANLGVLNAYRRMIYEDERANEADRIGFVLHLGDFIYEMVWYPEDRARYYDRPVREIVRYPNGEKIGDFHIPTTVDDYRLVYRNYLHDPDLQDARARWPFVPMWDNHEYSWQGYQGMQIFGGKTRPAQTFKVAANQAFFEYQPARMVKASGPSLEKFAPPKVENVPVKTFDENGLGQEPNNLAAINSLKGYRRLGWGAHVDLIITDQRSYRSANPGNRPEAEKLGDENFDDFLPEEVMQAIDGGRAYKKGNPPDVIKWGPVEVPNYRKHEAPWTFLGAEQKQWFLDQLRRSTATWKIWGSTTATLQERVDPQNLPEGFYKPWTGEGYAVMAGEDMSLVFAERGEIYDFIHEHGITGFAAVAGDRHAFWAGLAAKDLPPNGFSPVGLAFVGGSISTPGFLEAFENRKKKDSPLQPLFLAQGPNDQHPQPTANMLLRHGVRSCLEYQKTGDIQKARQLSNPELAPHLTFVDTGGHGYAVVRASSDQIETEFVCIPRPIKRADGEDGGPLRYRAIHTAKLWQKGKAPVLETKVVEGDAEFSI